MDHSSQLNQVSQHLLDFFTVPAGSDALPPLRLRHFGDTIRYNILGLTDNGDLSVCANTRFWQAVVVKQRRQFRSDTDELMPENEELQSLIENAAKWRFPLKEATSLPIGRYTLSFQRLPIIQYVIKNVLSQAGDYGRRRKTEQSPTLTLVLENGVAGTGEGAHELRQYRLQVIYDIVRRLAEYSPWHLVESKDAKNDTLRVHVELQKCTQSALKDHVCLVSGPVVEPVQKTGTKMTLENYLELRTTHMRQVAVHRNGIRPSGISNMDTLMKRLGAAAVIVDLISVRHQSAVTLVRNGLGSSKGASYILYNSARLETLLRTFNDKVKAKVYDPLPPLESIDLSILEDDMDWQLIYGYLLPFPEVLESLMEQLPQGSCGIHQFVRYIENLAGVTSRYYRHKKVLVQKRDQLSPILYARVYLIMTVRQVLNVVLAVLGIQPVDYI
ncbi:hypothetical protein KR038_005834 [Drosophila bunnanda]|nr:hypothetical protein KR038_005834 [Drosophila bunnanda]